MPQDLHVLQKRSWKAPSVNILIKCNFLGLSFKETSPSPCPRHYFSVHVSSFGLGTSVFSEYTFVTWAKRIIDKSSMQLPSLSARHSRRDCIPLAAAFHSYLNGKTQQISGFRIYSNDYRASFPHCFHLLLLWSQSYSFSLLYFFSRQGSPSLSRSAHSPELHDLLHQSCCSHQSFCLPSEMERNYF